MPRRTVQIDEAGHQRVEETAREMGFTQETAASILVQAATTDRIRELVTERMGRLGRGRPARPEPTGE